MILIKGSDEKITSFPWLVQSELDCNCFLSSCYYTHIDESVVRSFLESRFYFGAPIEINSAFRCQSWNNFCGGLDRSLHTIGMAMDLTTKDPNRMIELGQVLRRFFDVVIWYEDKKFYHCHNLPH